MYADNNLFNPAWTTGNLSAIAPIVQIVGFIAMCFISIGGFFMVILPIMRNVVNGIVVVAPDFCDKIDEAHRHKLGFQDNDGGNQIIKIIGPIAVMILSFFPNFKAISDFDKGIKDPTSFMIKGVSMMCVYVFIGVFIFYGYPSKFAEKFSTAATSIIDIGLNNIDPAAWIEKIPTNMARPDLSTSNATDTLGKNVNTLSKSIYSSLTGKYKEMSKESRITMSHEVEGYVNSKLSEISAYSDSTKYKLTVETRVMSYDPQLNERAPWPTPAHDEANNIYIFQFKAPVAETFTIGIPGDISSDHFMCILKFYELSEKGDQASNVRTKATFNPNATETKVTDGQKSCTLTLSGDYFSVSKGGVSINGISSTKVDTKSTAGKTDYVITFAVSANDFMAATEGITSGLFYIDKSNRSYQHNITSVSWGSSISFEPEDSTHYNGWSLGGSPTVKKSSEIGGTVEDTGTSNSGRVSDD